MVNLKSIETEKRPEYKYNKATMLWWLTIGNTDNEDIDDDI